MKDYKMIVQTGGVISKPAIWTPVSWENDVTIVWSIAVKDFLKMIGNYLCFKINNNGDVFEVSVSHSTPAGTPVSTLRVEGGEVIDGSGQPSTVIWIPIPLDENIVIRVVLTALRGAGKAYINGQFFSSISKLSGSIAKAVVIYGTPPAESLPAIMTVFDDAESLEAERNAKEMLNPTVLEQERARAKEEEIQTAKEIQSRVYQAQEDARRQQEDTRKAAMNAANAAAGRRPY